MEKYVMVFRSVRAVEVLAEAGVSICRGQRIFTAAKIHKVVNYCGKAGRNEVGCSGNRGQEED